MGDVTNCGAVRLPLKYQCVLHTSRILLHPHAGQDRPPTAHFFMQDIAGYTLQSNHRAGRGGRNLAEIGPKLIDAGPKFVPSRWSIPGQVWPIAAEVAFNFLGLGPRLAEFNPSLTVSGHMFAESGRVRSQFGGSRPSFVDVDRFWANVGQAWPNSLAQIGGTLPKDSHTTSTETPHQVHTASSMSTWIRGRLQTRTTRMLKDPQQGSFLLRTPHRDHAESVDVEPQRGCVDPPTKTSIPSHSCLKAA